jgi:predicted aspartyl protease
VFRYPYKLATVGSPPAPFVLLNVAALGSDEWEMNVAALADTGADVTVIPDNLVETLGLVALDSLPTMGLGGTVTHRKTYGVRLLIRDLPAVEIEVVGSADWKYAILGRDVLNRYRVVFDGPNQRLEIGV